MADSTTPPKARPRLSGLQPDLLMANGLVNEGSGIVQVNGIEIQGELGRGGMGSVYLGKQLSLDRDVAVKVLASELANDPLFLERLEREARVMAKLRHPHLVAVHDFQRTEDGAAIVMEFIEGGTLRDRLKNHPKGLPLAEALSLIKQIASALEAAHTAGIIHRDMKPENVLVDALGVARVSDFGLALPLHEATARLTLTGAAVGTVDYMAPEQLKGLDIDKRLDIYALGVIAYELFTGVTPRGSFDAPHRARAEMPRQMSEAVMRALKPDPKDRFTSIREFVDALESGAKAKSRPWWLLALGALMITALGAIMFFSEDQSSISTATETAGPWRDGTAGARIYEDVLLGDWKKESGVLTSTDQICIIKLEDRLPDEYDVKMKFTRLRGIHSVALFFKTPAGVASAEVDAWEDSLAGVQNIGDESLLNGYGFRFAIENGRSYELLVEIRADKVRMSIDGGEFREFNIKGKPLSITKEWEWNPADRPAALAIGSYMASTRFDEVQWRPVVKNKP
ncbi:MAG: serine/threonine protein kinase [Verrucomicrobiaceae bacterium]|nr:serine/threonine protein kinase [Verrucomicrobiaceae bacterium]